MKPNTPATEHRGRKERQGAAFIHISQGQIIYHLVQTNSVLSEEEGFGWGGGAVHEGCWRCCSLTPITLSLISPARPSPHYSTHRASEAPVTAHVKEAELWRGPTSSSPTSSTSPFIYSRNLCTTHQARCPKHSEGADLQALAGPSSSCSSPLGADVKERVNRWGEGGVAASGRWEAD